MVNAPSLPPAGVSCALVTPVTADGDVDLDGVRTLVERAAAAGVRGISPAGSTGEGSRLTRTQRRRVVAHVAAVASGLPVLAGVPAQAVDDALDELDQLAAAGADAALVAPPGFYAQDDAEVLGYVERLAARTPLPLVLYHIPGLAGAGFSPEVAARLADGPAVVGLKDSSRDLTYLRAVVEATADAAFTVLTGTDALFVESLEAGATGAIAASPNVAPDLAVRVWQAWKDGERERALRLQNGLRGLVDACRAAGFPAGWKYAASVTGACAEHPVPPGRTVPPTDRAAIDRVVAELEAPRAS